ncbi:MAG: alpha/beta fold hydrolase [Caulobacteraceae bacterium]|jgi:pimeloyl-ACP methyl ester carboxylesterase
MAKLDRGGVAIHYDIEGEGPVLLLSHGYSATGEMWRDQVEALKDRFRVVTWDMRGHGRSDYPDDPAAYSEALTVGDMAALLDAASVERAVLGGLSLGGYMSLAFNLAHPERVRALLVIDTGPGYRSDEAREGWNKNALRTAERYETEGLARLQRGTAEMRASSHRDASGLVRAARGMLTQRDAAVISSLPTIAVPSLVVVGANDAPFLAAADYMAGKIPGAKKVIIPDAGHAANMDQPAAFNAAVRGFLLEAGLDQAP